MTASMVDKKDQELFALGDRQVNMPANSNLPTTFSTLRDDWVREPKGERKVASIETCQRCYSGRG
jgi:hypothetical protein